MARFAVRYQPAPPEVSGERARGATIFTAPGRWSRPRSDGLDPRVTDGRQRITPCSARQPSLSPLSLAHLRRTSTWFPSVSLRILVIAIIARIAPHDPGALPEVRAAPRRANPAASLLRVHARSARDVFSRVLFGRACSSPVGSARLHALAVPLGVLAGYFGR
jgi:ABC-type dipeptide/oligopeptide/nickel transport system permease subunit